MGKSMSEFIYIVDMDHNTEDFGVWGLAGFNNRDDALDYCENMARNNPEISVTVRIRPRITKKNILAMG